MFSAFMSTCHWFGIWRPRTRERRHLELQLMGPLEVHGLPRIEKMMDFLPFPFSSCPVLYRFVETTGKCSRCHKMRKLDNTMIADNAHPTSSYHPWPDSLTILGWKLSEIWGWTVAHILCLAASRKPCWMLPRVGSWQRHLFWKGGEPKDDGGCTAHL